MDEEDKVAEEEQGAIEAILLVDEESGEDDKDSDEVREGAGVSEGAADVALRQRRHTHRHMHRHERTKKFFAEMRSLSSNRRRTKRAEAYAMLPGLPP